MKKSIRKFYEWRDSKEHEERDNQNFIPVLKLFEKNKENGDTCFLDIGCYDGSKTILISEYTGARPFGIDFLSDRLLEANEKGIQTNKCDLNEESIPYPDESFDFIFCGDVIEHLYSPDFLLEEIFRLLKPNGYAVITTPNMASWKGRVSLMFGWQPPLTEVSTKYKVGNPRIPNEPPSGHIRVFTPISLIELVKLYSFGVEYIGGHITHGKPVDLFNRFTMMLDEIFLRIYPSMCDTIVIKIRKPLK